MRGKLSGMECSDSVGGSAVELRGVASAWVHFQSVRRGTLITYRVLSSVSFATA